MMNFWGACFPVFECGDELLRYGGKQVFMPARSKSDDIVATPIAASVYSGDFLNRGRILFASADGGRTL